MFSGGKIPKPIIAFQLESTRTTAKISCKQHVRKSLCPTEMFWVELIMFFQTESNIKWNNKMKGKRRSIFPS